MNKIYFLKPATIILMVICCIVSNTSIACVDYHPIPPPITVRVDSNFNYMEITVHQLNIFAGATGDFCTCALSSYSNLFSSIYYVAFVDSGTTNPINGFAVWNANANATTEWSAVMPGSTWSGFVAAVVNNMIPGLPVELIIKANLPFGYTIATIDCTLVVSSLGTDQWDNTANVLANTHNSISGFGSATYFLVSPGYFTGIADLENNSGITIFPNPNNGEFSIAMPGEVLKSELEIYNVLGENIYSKVINGQPVINIDLSGQSDGIYFLRLLQNNKVIKTGKLTITN